MAVLVPFAICLFLSYYIVSTVYYLFFHPLSKTPGPFLSRFSSLPSFYHACKADRHIWIWQNFQIYGPKFRSGPNTVLFSSAQAYLDVYSPKSNLKKSKFYDAWVRNENDLNTLNSSDVEVHAKKRKLLNLAFTDQSVKSAGPFMAQRIDRWNSIIASGKDWTDPINVSTSIDYLFLDILGDLCFGAQFKTMEPGDNPLKQIPHAIADYMKLQNSIAKSPLLDLVLWLKPRGLNALVEAITPPAVKSYYDFVAKSVDERWEQHQRGEKKPREDMFHYLCSAIDPETGGPAFTKFSVLGEASLLIIAGSDTSATTLSGFFFYLCKNPSIYKKLVTEIRTTFDSVEEIEHGPKLASCKYVRACIDEAMRMSPPAPSELERVVRPGGYTIDGVFYPEGTNVGVPNWSWFHSEELYGDPNVFRPERWLVTEDNPVERVNELKRLFLPFLKGTGNCAGQKIAILQLTLAVCRTFWRLDCRIAPGSSLGEGSPARGWGRRDRNRYQLDDAYISLKTGPMVQFRERQM